MARTGFPFSLALDVFRRPPSIHLRIRFFSPILILPYLKARIQVTINAGSFLFYPRSIFKSMLHVQGSPITRC